MDVLEATEHRDACGKVHRSGLGEGHNRRPTSRRPHCLLNRPRAHGALDMSYYDILRAPTVLGVNDVLFLSCLSGPSAADATTAPDLARLRKWWAPWLMMCGVLTLDVTLLVLCWSSVALKQNPKGQYRRLRKSQLNSTGSDRCRLRWESGVTTRYSRYRECGCARNLSNCCSLS